MGRKKKIIEEIKFVPSKYQSAIYDFVEHGVGNLVVEAAAGAGKTTTLLEILKLLPSDKKILFCAFNKDIVKEIQKKVSKELTNVDIRTVHSLGFLMIQRNFRDKEIIPNEDKYKQFIINNLNEISRIDVNELKYRDKQKYIDNLCKLSDFARYNLCQSHKDIEKIVERYNIEVIADEITATIDIMEWGKSFIDEIDYTDMIWLPNILYLKPLGLQYDYILGDEVQDFSICQRELLLKCRKINTRMFFLGDKNQCQPAGTKILMHDGSEKNIEDIVVGDKLAYYDFEQGSFQGIRKYFDFYSKTNIFTEVKAISNRNVNKTIKIYCKNNSLSSEYSFDHICCVKFNKELMKNSYCLYLMENKDGLFRIGKTKMYNNNGHNFALQVRMRNEDCIKAWILDIYNNEKEARFNEIKYSYFFGIPQTVFNYDRINKKGYFTNEDVKKIYEIFLDIRERAFKCLNYFNKKYDCPFSTIDNTKKRSKTHLFYTNACNIFPNFMEVNVLDKDNEIKAIKDKIGKKPYYHIKYQFQKVEKVDVINEEKKVYSLEVDRTHTYIADGILTHNCLYSFASADPESFDVLKSLPNTISLPLSISYRCPKNIVKFAQNIVPSIEHNENNLNCGEIKYNVDLSEVEDGDMVLCRNNAPLMKIYNDFIRMGKKCQIKGKDIGLNLRRLVKSIKQDDLNVDLEKDGLFVRLYNSLFETRDKMIKQTGLDSKTIMENSKIIAKLDMIKALEVLSEGLKTSEELIEKISQMFSDKKINGISLSTIHKAKGLEANNVFIACPSLMPCKSATQDWEILQEKNLMYVAYTRAKNKLCFIDEKDFKNFTNTTTESLKYIEQQVNFILGKESKINKIDSTYGKYILSRNTGITRPTIGTSKVLGEKTNKPTNGLLMKNKRKK